MRVCDEPTRLYKNIKYVCKINSVRLADIEEPREAGTISRFEKRGTVMNLPVWILYNVYRKTGVTIEDLIEKDLTADRKDENSSEKPNNCEYAENPSGDAWECGCFPDTYCEHQIYDRNPDGTINIVECRYEPKDEPQYDFGEYADRLWKIAYERGKREALEQTEPTISKMEQVEEPQTCSVNGRPYSECSSCEHFKCTADEPQTDCPWK